MARPVLLALGWVVCLWLALGSQGVLAEDKALADIIDAARQQGVPVIVLGSEMPPQAADSEPADPATLVATFESDAEVLRDRLGDLLAIAPDLPDQYGALAARAGGGEGGWPLV
jgi:sugar phosphate isomerase/epimerase